MPRPKNIAETARRAPGGGRKSEGDTPPRQRRVTVSEETWNKLAGEETRTGKSKGEIIDNVVNEWTPSG